MTSKKNFLKNMSILAMIIIMNPVSLIFLNRIPLLDQSQTGFRTKSYSRNIIKEHFKLAATPEQGAHILFNTRGTVIGELYIPNTRHNFDMKLCIKSLCKSERSIC